MGIITIRQFTAEEVYQAAMAEETNIPAEMFVMNIDGEYASPEDKMGAVIGAINAETDTLPKGVFYDFSGFEIDPDLPAGGSGMVLLVFNAPKGIGGMIITVNNGVMDSQIYAPKELVQKLGQHTQEWKTECMAHAAKYGHEFHGQVHAI